MMKTNLETMAIYPFAYMDEVSTYISAVEKYFSYDIKKEICMIEDPYWIIKEEDNKIYRFIFKKDYETKDKVKRFFYEEIKEGDPFISRPFIETSIEIRLTYFEEFKDFIDVFKNKIKEINEKQILSTL